MKALLHNPITHLFLKDTNAWTVDPDEAKTFADVPSAERFAKTLHLGHAKIFLKFEAPEPQKVEQ